MHKDSKLMQAVFTHLVEQVGTEFLAMFRDESPEAFKSYVVNEFVTLLTHMIHMKSLPMQELMDLEAKLMADAKSKGLEIKDGFATGFKTGDKIGMN